jgi:hypothetical protein
LLGRATDGARVAAPGGDPPAKIGLSRTKRLGTPEVQTAGDFGDAGRRILAQRRFESSPKFTLYLQALCSGIAPLRVDLLSQVSWALPVSRHSLKQHDERELEMMTQAAQVIERGFDAAGHPSPESARGGAGKGREIFPGRALGLIQAAIEIRPQGCRKLVLLQARHRCQHLPERRRNPETVLLLS